MDSKRSAIRVKASHRTIICSVGVLSGTDHGVWQYADHQRIRGSRIGDIIAFPLYAAKRHFIWNIKGSQIKFYPVLSQVFICSAGDAILDESCRSVHRDSKTKRRLSGIFLQYLGVRAMIQQRKLPSLTKKESP